MFRSYANRKLISTIAVLQFGKKAEKFCKEKFGAAEMVETKQKKKTLGGRSRELSIRVRCKFNINCFESAYAAYLLGAVCCCCRNRISMRLFILTSARCNTKNAARTHTHGGSSERIIAQHILGVHTRMYSLFGASGATIRILIRT